MGIKGIYQEIGPGERIALQKLAVQTYEAKGRPLRLAIDISIWLFQMQSGRGGTNPALRTFYYRLLRLMAFSIHPLFVFDGPNKPPFKRDKRTGPNVASIPDFLAKQLLKQFAIPFHVAPGEAEAECALLQKKGLVDAVLSEDVDTLMFGSGLTLRSWSPEPGSGSKINTHVNLYDAEKTKAGKSGLDREGMILVAMMSGGDYLPEGIPGCGPKTACEAARAGFGSELCEIGRGDAEGIATWKERLCHELKHNESKFFARKHKALVVPDEFPRKDILRYYTTPVISSDSQLETLEAKLVWDKPLDLAGLRTFCGEAFDWVCISGAKKFVRNIAPCLLVRDLRLKADEEAQDELEKIREQEGLLITGIHGRRNHKTTDGETELRISYVPLELARIDLDAEDPDPEIPVDVEEDEDDGGPAPLDSTEPSSPKKRGPYKYDPLESEKLWLLETYVKVGVPLTVEEWEESSRKAEQAKALKEAAKVDRMAARQEKALKNATLQGGMQKGALDRFTKVTKPGISQTKSFNQTMPSLLGSPLKRPTPSSGSFRSDTTAVVDLLSSPEQDTAPSKRTGQRTFRRVQSDTTALQSTSVAHSQARPLSPLDERAALPELPRSVSIRRRRSPLASSRSKANEQGQDPVNDAAVSRNHDVFVDWPKRPTGPISPSKSCRDVITISSSPASTPRSTRQRSITEWASPTKKTGTTPYQTVAALDLIANEELDASLSLRVTNFQQRLASVAKSLPSNGTYSGELEAVKQKRTVRIRESLEGAWTLDQAKCLSATPDAKRQRSVSRTFEFSDVPVLDMTDDL